MQFNFTDIIDRHGRDALAVDSAGMYPGFSPAKPKDGFDFIPMWVADMNFATAPAVTAALEERIKHPLYGYFANPAEYYNTIINWHKTRNGICDLTRREIGYENSVLNGVCSALKICCSPGDGVLLNTPAYSHFTDVITDNGYRLIPSEMKRDEDGIWRMDLADMERKIVSNRIHAMIFCSPHNPTGRVWEREELEALMALCKKHDLTVIADEIWSDLTLGDHKHIPLYSVSEDAKQRTVCLYACTKTFNLAGLGGAYHIIFNKKLRERISQENEKTCGTSLNVLSMHALIGAYSDGGQQWADELRQVLAQNTAYAHEFFALHGISAAKPQGTYMLFLDCTEWCREHDMTLDELLQAGWDVGVGWQDGRPFYGSCHIRINTALPFSRLEEALSRLQKYVFK